MKAFVASVIALCLQIPVVSQAPAPVQTRSTPAPATATTPKIRTDHPRLFMTSQELPGLRDRIAKHYRAEFQSFIDLLNDTGALPKRTKKIEVNWAGFNFAFVAALDPQEMARRGFHFKAPLTTSRAYCDRAIESARPLLPAIALAQGQTGGALSTGYPVPKYLSAITTYDWCYDQMTA